MRSSFTAIACAGLGLLGCSESAPPAATGSRFAAVKATPGAAAKPAGNSFCDETWPAGAKRFTPPPLTTVTSEPAPGRWRWVNLWATWCGPCLEELPLLKSWGEALAADGTPIAFQFVSVDADRPALDSFDKSRLPGSISWLPEQSRLGLLLKSAGVSESSAIPVHALVDPQGWLRCARAGSVKEGAYGAIKQLVGSP